jgi:hypothetical protein
MSVLEKGRLRMPPKRNIYTYLLRESAPKGSFTYGGTAPDGAKK